MPGSSAHKAKLRLYPSLKEGENGSHITETETCPLHQHSPFIAPPKERQRLSQSRISPRLRLSDANSSVTGQSSATATAATADSADSLSTLTRDHSGLRDLPVTTGNTTTSNTNNSLTGSGTQSAAGSTQPPGIHQTADSHTLRDLYKDTNNKTQPKLTGNLKNIPIKNFTQLQKTLVKDYTWLNNLKRQQPPICDKSGKIKIVTNVNELTEKDMSDMSIAQVIASWRASTGIHNHEMRILKEELRTTSALLFKYQQDRRLNSNNFSEETEREEASLQLNNLVSKVQELINKGECTVKTQDQLASDSNSL